VRETAANGRATELPASVPEPASAVSELYFNRELSWLEFNDRVIQLAEDDRLPLLERVKFLAIYAHNLDEFFMVRVAGVHDQIDAGVTDPGSDGLTPSETIDAIAEGVRKLERRRCHVFERELEPALAEAGVSIQSCDDCSPEDQETAYRRFRDEIFPVLTPLAVGPGRPFPYISNLSLSVAVRLRDHRDETEAFARVKVPKEMLGRFLEVSPSTFVPLETVIARHLDDLFPGMEILAHGFFLVTRDADFTVSDEADDLLRAVEDELRGRRFGEVVRLEVSSRMDRPLREWLTRRLQLEERQVYEVDGPLGLADLWQIHDIDGHRELRDPPWSPLQPPAYSTEKGERNDMFAAMRAGDVLVHHPYDSFAASVERFVQQATHDPDVLAIKMTVYRTSDDSALIPSLIEAAEMGKEAVCMVELKARFDERRNIGWARVLEEAGVHVVHGLPGLKTHAKALLVVRREGNRVRHYVHVGTGNYNIKTARLYEDFGLFTTDPEIAADVTDLFNLLTGYARPKRFRTVLVSPDHSRRGILEEIEKTIQAHRAGQPARIVMKMNSLVDRTCIDALYRASCAGVKVDLNVRGICRLRPGVAGLSDNIRVRSVVGRFLEHSRIYGFQRNGERDYYIGSADLMPRNLDTRVELLVPVTDPALRAELEDTLERCLADDTFSWELHADGQWTRQDGRTRSVQRELMARALERAGTPQV
jgi:polyphosphate kinase